MKRTVTLKGSDSEKEVTVRITTKIKRTKYNTPRHDADKKINYLTDKVVEHILMPDFHFSSIQRT